MEVVARFSAHLRGVQGFAPTTVATYADTVDRFGRWLATGDRGPLTAADHGDVVAWITEQVELGLAPATRALNLCGLRSFYDWLPDRADDPTDRVGAARATA